MNDIGSVCPKCYALAQANLHRRCEVHTQERRARFLKAARGLSAWQTGRVMSNAGTPGVVWKGSPKSRMADAYADSFYVHYSVDEGVIAALEAAPRGKP